MIRRIVPIVIISLAALVAAAQTLTPAPPPPPNRAPAPAVAFRNLDIFVDSHAKALAAYQFELLVKNGDALIVGIEGGTHAAFKEPPFYDPAAMQKNRIIIAAFNTADAKDLPTGKIRVARLHLQVRGDVKPEYAIKLDTAATVDGSAITAEGSIAEGELR